MEPGLKLFQFSMKRRGPFSKSRYPVKPAVFRIEMALQTSRGYVTVRSVALLPLLINSPKAEINDGRFVLPGTILSAGWGRNRNAPARGTVIFFRAPGIQRPGFFSTKSVCVGPPGPRGHPLLLSAST